MLALPQVVTSPFLREQTAFRLSVPIRFSIESCFIEDNLLGFSVAWFCTRPRITKELLSRCLPWLLDPGVDRSRPEATTAVDIQGSLGNLRIPALFVSAADNRAVARFVASVVTLALPEAQ